MTTFPARPSNPSLLVVGRGIGAAREELLASWYHWILARQAASVAVQPDALQRQLALILNVLTHMTGPLRREANGLWFGATELYGRLAAVRGLAAGEVVEELQYLRELMIRELSDFFVALPVRQQLPTILRLNRVLDSGVASAVVGYTDALVANLFQREGVPVPTADHVQQLLAQLEGLEVDLKGLKERERR